MRSKLLSLHLIHMVVNSYFGIFFTLAPSLFSSSFSDTPLFVHSIKQYYCLFLSRNSASVVPQVFDTAMDIFGKSLVGLRPVLKVDSLVLRCAERAFGDLHGNYHPHHRGSLHRYVSSACHGSEIATESIPRPGQRGRKDSRGNIPQL